MLKITTCPNCGSRKLKAVQRDLVRSFDGQPYTVPALEFHECPVCGEKLFGPDAMQKIQSVSPGYAGVRVAGSRPAASGGKDARARAGSRR
jgi:YgiT-type zinc finger domain-containing protein